MAKNSWLWAVALAAGAYLLYKSMNVSAGDQFGGTTGGASYPVQSGVNPSATAQYPYPVNVQQTKQVIPQSPGGLIPLSSTIQIYEQGKALVSPYQVVQTPSGMLGISAVQDRYTEVSPGFYNKMVQAGIAPQLNQLTPQGSSGGSKSLTAQKSASAIAASQAQYAAAKAGTYSRTGKNLKR